VDLAARAADYFGAWDSAAGLGRVTAFADAVLPVQVSSIS
jgi:hypothetical protein